MAFQETGGELVTIEIDREPGEEARRNVQRAGLEDVVDVRIADAFAEIPRIRGDFDFVFIDAWKPDYMKFLELLRDRVSPGGALVAHNVTNYARDMQDFLKAIREDTGLETTLLEISAEGMSVSFVCAQEPVGEDHVRRLIEDLASEDWEKAVSDLASVGDTAVPLLIEALHAHSGHRYQPYRAALALGRVGSEPALQGLLKAWEDPSIQDHVRRGIFQGLGEIGTDRAAQALISSVKDETTGVSMRRAAVRALGQVPTEEVVGFLDGILHDEETALGHACVLSLAQIGSDAALDSLIVALRDHPSYLSGEGVLEVLKERRRDALLPFLFETLRQDSWWNWDLASKALVDVGLPAEDTLIDMIRDENSEMRRRSACILGKISSEKATDRLIELLDDEDWMVRNEAVVALARIPRGRPVQPLVEKIRAKIPDAGWASDFLASEAARLDRPGYASLIPPPASTPYDSQSGIALPVYPEILERDPQVPSPIRTSDGHEYLTAVTREGRSVLVSVTIENGEPYVYAQSGKGMQLAVDAADFPVFAANGLHSEAELDRTLAITGRSIAEITALGRPERSSGIGFMARDEDIISVLKGDNRLVKAMGLTHPELARPMFHMWNTVLEQTMAYRARRRPYADLEYFRYFGKKIYIEKMDITKGWQESIFEDEIIGGYHIHIRRGLDDAETAVLKSKYGHLRPEQLQEMTRILTRFHTGEMEPYYIMRYGFYEGHTDYRVDPITIAFIFGLRSLEELDAAFPGRLYEALTSHFTRGQDEAAKAGNTPAAADDGDRRTPEG
jgi:HEAT repeat protein